MKYSKMFACEVKSFTHVQTALFANIDTLMLLSLFQVMKHYNLHYFCLIVTFMGYRKIKHWLCMYSRVVFSVTSYVHCKRLFLKTSVDLETFLDQMQITKMNCIDSLEIHLWYLFMNAIDTDYRTNIMCSIYCYDKHQMTYI